MYVVRRIVNVLTYFVEANYVQTDILFIFNKSNQFINV